MRAVILISICSLFTAGAAWTQPTWMLPPGTRVRVALESSQTIGTVVSAEPDSLKIRFPGEDSTSALAWSAISSLDISRPAPRAERAKTGAAIGGIAGALVGGVVGAQKRGRNREYIDPAVAGGTVGLVVGAAVGGAIGAASTSEQWERVWPLVTFRAARRPMRSSNFRATPTFGRP
jgi:hypothetical protein